MIHTFRARNYGCLRDVTAALTPLHAFIGPNDSGKSTLLNGMRTLVRLASGLDSEALASVVMAFDPFISGGSMLACDVDGGRYAYEVGEHWARDRRIDGDAAAIKRQLLAARLVRFDPDALREARGLIPETGQVDFLDDRGHGLGGVYFAIRNRDDSSFAAITEDVRRDFPTIQSFRVKAVTSSEVTLEAQLVTGERVDVRRMSEGLLYYLAFAALRHLDPVSLVLVEEPENGLHPTRIADVVGVLREVSKTTQVVVATHSPLVINELQPEEVSIVTRTAEDGTKITPITKTHNFEKRASVYALGELWLSYANGVDEEPLIHGRDAP
jgi:predicted ATPase